MAPSVFFFLLQRLPAEYFFPYLLYVIYQHSCCTTNHIITPILPCAHHHSRLAIVLKALHIRYHLLEPYRHTTTQTPKPRHTSTSLLHTRASPSSLHLSCTPLLTPFLHQTTVIYRPRFRILGIKKRFALSPRLFFKATEMISGVFRSKMPCLNLYFSHHSILTVFLQLLM